MYYVRFGMMDNLFAQKVKETKNYSTSTQKKHTVQISMLKTLFSGIIFQFIILQTPTSKNLNIDRKFLICIMC